MENTGYIALSRQTTLWRQLDVIANNVANMNTPGYRGQEMLFSSYLARTPNDDSAFREKVNFVQDFGVVHDMTSGPMKATDNPLDVAIDGEGFFVIETAAGQKYTRGGHFGLDDNGQLVTSDGLPVMSDNDTPLFIAPNESLIEISRDGTVATENGPIGRLKVVNFEEPQSLRKVAGSLFDAGPGAEPETMERPTVVQGMLEGSNVNGVVEMSKMIKVQQAYGQVQQMLDKENERVSKAMQAWARRAV